MIQQDEAEAGEERRECRAKDHSDRATKEHKQEQPQQNLKNIRKEALILFEARRATRKLQASQLYAN